MGYYDKYGSHKADLNAHTFEPSSILRTGTYFVSGIGVNAARVFVVNKLYASPLVITRDITVDRIAIHITTADAGKSVRLGIYKDGTNLYPGTLLLDAGTVSAATTGVKAITISQALTKGIYWMAAVSDGAPQAHAQSYTEQYPNLLGLQAARFDRYDNCWSVAFTYAALPDPFTGGGAFDTGQGWIIPVRVLTLD